MDRAELHAVARHGTARRDSRQRREGTTGGWRRRLWRQTARRGRRAPGSGSVVAARYEATATPAAASAERTSPTVSGSAVMSGARTPSPHFPIMRSAAFTGTGFGSRKSAR